MKLRSKKVFPREIHKILFAFVVIAMALFCSACGGGISSGESQSVDESEKDLMPSHSSNQEKEKQESSLNMPAFSKLSLTPSDVNNEGFSTISCSGATVMVVDSGGTLWGWGSNTDMQIIQDASIEIVEYPTKIMDNVVSVCVEPHYALAIDTNGGLWGLGSVIELSEEYGPRKLLETPVIAASAYQENVTVISATGAVGEGKAREYYTPEFKSVLKDAVSVSTGYSHTLATKNDGTLWGWGDNRYGQLGKNAPLRENSFYVDPFQIMADAVSVYAGDRCSYAIKSDGSVWAWGCISFDGTADSEEITMDEPTKIFDDAVGLAGNESGVYIIKEDGTLWGWGFCRFGELGNRLTKGDCSDDSYQLRPIKLDDDVLAVACNGFTTYWIKSDRCLYGCGLSYMSMLGDPNVGNDMGCLWGVDMPIQTVPIKIMENVMIPADLQNWQQGIISSPANADFNQQDGYQEEVPSSDANSSNYPDIAGSWQDSWSERCSMTISEESDGYYHVDVFWGSGASSYDEWKFSGEYDFSTGVLTYKDGIWLTCAEDESGYPQEGLVLDNMNGTLRFDRDSGHLLWTDNTSVEYGYNFGSSNMRFEQIN